MSEINTDGIKQEFREDIKDILDDIEEEYDDDDIQIDDSDVDDFLTEDSSFDNNSSDFSNYTDPSLDETIPKEEPYDNFDTSSQYPTTSENESDYNSSVRSEASDNFDTSSEYHENTNDYSSYDQSTDVQQSNYYPQSSQGYLEPEHSQQGYDGTNHDGDASNYSSDQYVKDEYVEDEWKKEIKNENLYSIDSIEQAGFEQNLPIDNSQHNQIKPAADGWIADNSVPQGWKHKTTLGNNKTFVCSPAGKSFDSRKNALKFMKANHYPAEEIALMDECLKYEGWKVDEYLPEGWKYRPGKNIGIEYMTSEEKILISSSGASKEIAAFYPPEVLNRFKFFTQRISKRKGRAPVTTNERHFPPVQGRVPGPRPAVRPEEWTADHTIPVGWRMRNANGKQILLSPNGLQFNSRRAAFQELVTKNYPDEMKAEMFDKLAFEGFQANELLPFGWIYQKTEGDLLNFLNREGKLLSSFTQALEFLRSSRESSAEEIKRFQMFQNLLGPGNVQNPVWNENDQTVPIGWKTRPVGNSNLKVFLSPNDYELKSRRLALKHMMEIGYSQEAVEEMRRFLSYEGWMDDQSLPYLWKMKKNGQNILFVSKEGFLLESPKIAIDYIGKNSYIYNHEDVQRIEYVSNMVQRSTQVNRSQGQDRRRSVAQIPSQISVRKVDTNYVEDGSVPKGWKVKTDALRPSYMAPNGSTYKSRRTAYHAMIQERYPNEEIESMRKTLKYDGWLDNSELPGGWKIKQMKGNVYLMDRGGELFKSYLEAAKFIETYVQYFTQDDLDKINRLAKINQPVKSLSSTGSSQWVENDNTVPRGWKSKCRNGKGKKLMSPDGLVFPSRKSALGLMVKSHAPEEQLEEMRISLAHEGWIKMVAPRAWMFKQRSGYAYHFLSSEGIVLESKGQAMEHLMKTGLLTEENKRSIEMLKSDVRKVGSSSPRSYVRRERAPQQITPDATWILGDVTVPDGWRVKEVVQHGKTFKMVLSPHGLSFRNRRSALSYMVKNNFPSEETDEIRQSLAHDGWNEDLLLPSNWRFKAKRPFLYCSDEGEVILSHINAIRKLKSLEKYTPEMLNDLKRFIDNHGGTRKEYATKTPGNEGYKSITKIFENAANKDDLMKTLDGLGWKQNKYLPTDWLFKDAKGGNQHIDVLSSEGKKFISYKQAVVYMRSSEKYTEKDIQDFYLFPDGKTRSLRMSESRALGGNDSVSSDWIENDDTVPKGWKSKLWLGSASKKCLLSPGGQIFTSRIGAYKYLIKCGSMEQIEEMRTLLGFDGWQEYALLPAGWLYRKKEYNNQYLTELGEKISGNISAIKKIGENENYSNKIEDLNKFVEEQKSEKFNSSLKTYHESSRTGNLRWLIESGADLEEVNKLRMELMEDGWKGNQYLPENWLHKDKVGNHTLNVLSAEGCKYISYKAAIQFMKTNDRYTESDIQQFRLFPNGKTSGKFVNKFASQSKVALDDPSWKEDDETVPKGWKSRKMEGKDVTMLQTPDGVVYWSRRAALKDILKNGGSAFDIEEIRKSLAHDGWKTFDNLPKGWMYKRKEPRSMYLTETGELVDGHTKAQKLIAEDDKYLVEDQTNIRNFVLEICQTEKPSFEKSPKLSSSKSSLFESLQEKLRSGNTPEKERAIKELEAKGWNENEYLPEGWRYKKYKSTQQINVLSSEGDLYHSYRAVLLKFASDEKKFSNEDAERFKRFPDGKLHKVEVKKYISEKVKGKYYSLKQYQEALKKENNDEEVNEIKEYYIEKGWIEDSNILPAMWLFRQKTGLTSLNFLTPSGELLLSTKEANKYLESHGVSQVIDANKCKSRFGTNYELELKRLEKKVKLEANLELPSGIKIEKASQDIKKEKDPKGGKIVPDVSNFKFYSLEEFDNKSNVHLAEFKGVFEQLESFKKTITTKKVKIEPSFDLDFD